MVQTFRVSHLAAFARWRADEESEDVGWLVNQIRSNEETETMRKGTAFHKALENIRDGFEGAEIRSGEYRFVFTVDITISLPHTRELRRGKDYGGIIVSGQADGLGAKQIIDHKSTARFDAEKYLEGQQWRYYLDIFEADQFTWYAWEMKEIDAKVYEVFGFHQLSQYRYPELERDCRELALDFKRFADRYLPDYSFRPDERCVRAPEPPQFAMLATKGTNVIGVGWKDGVLRVAFAGKTGPRFGRYKGVPRTEAEKLVRSPFPDKLFTQIIKGKYEYESEQSGPVAA